MFFWFFIMTPILIGYGTSQTINLTYTALQHEEPAFNQSLPTLISSHLVFIAYAVVIGFSYGWLLFSIPVMLEYSKYFGIVLLFVIAYFFWSREKQITRENTLSISEEFILQALKPFVPLLMIAMYSLFLDITQPLFLQVIIMTICIVIINLMNQLMIIAAGFLMGTDSLNDRLLRNIDWTMAGITALFAILLLFV